MKVTFHLEFNAVAGASTTDTFDAADLGIDLEQEPGAIQADLQAAYENWAWEQVSGGFEVEP